MQFLKQVLLICLAFMAAILLVKANIDSKEGNLKDGKPSTEGDANTSPKVLEYLKPYPFSWEHELICSHILIARNRIDFDQRNCYAVLKTALIHI